MIDGMARHGTAWHGMARHGTARDGMAIGEWQEEALVVWGLGTGDLGLGTGSWRRACPGDGHANVNGQWGWAVARGATAMGEAARRARPAV
jgi:hypothetical protein